MNSKKETGGDPKAAGLAELGVYAFGSDQPTAKLFYLGAKDYLTAGAFLMEAVEAKTLRLNEYDVIDQSLSHAAELALKAHMMARDVRFIPQAAKHGILSLFEHIGKSAEAIAAERGMHDAVDELVHDIMYGPNGLEAVMDEPPELIDAEIPVDVRSLFEWYGMHLGYYGSLFRYPVPKLRCGDPLIVRRTEDGGYSFFNLRRFAFKSWIEAYLLALYAPIFEGVSDDTPRAK